MDLRKIIQISNSFLLNFSKINSKGKSIKTSFLA